MYLDPRGNVLACCLSHLQPLGNIADAPLEALWRGPAAERLRAAVAGGADVLPPACRHCRWQVDDGNHEEVFARQFDRFAPAAATDWPAQIEFALSNRCNLACVMCNGDFSSTIRSRREGRAPLPVVYDDGFFAQLPPFLARLEQARFLGGEPFLVPEYHRIWDLLADQDRPVACDVTTNGTVWTPRVEAALDALPFSIGVSVDGVTAATVEAVRVGADHRELMANVERFAAYCHRRGTPFTLTYCLMTVNWAELPAFVGLAADLGATVVVNTVTWPPHLSLYELPPDELTRVVDELTAATDEPTVRTELGRLRRWVDRRRTGPGDAHFERWSPLPAGEAVVPAPVGDPGHRLREIAEGPVGVLVTDADDVVVAVEGPDVLGVPAGQLLGADYGTALRRLADDLGRLVLVADAARSSSTVVRDLLFDGPGAPVRVRGVTTVGPGPGARTALGRVRRFPAD